LPLGFLSLLVLSIDDKTFYGCINESACNYDELATTDDGSCDFDCKGCTNPNAWNYDEFATVDDGLCLELHLTLSDINKIYEKEGLHQLADEKGFLLKYRITIGSDLECPIDNL